MNSPKRKPNRLPGYDYSSPGAYFITICTKNRKCILSRIVGGGVLDAPDIYLTDIGKIVERHLCEMNAVYTFIHTEKYIIMPNHIHLIVAISGYAPEGSSGTPTPTNMLIPRYISTFKRMCNKDIGKNIWQRSFHDHIIRNENDYRKIWEYVDGNAQKWQEDCFFTSEEA